MYYTETHYRNLEISHFRSYPTVHGYHYLTTVEAKSKSIPFFLKKRIGKKLKRWKIMKNSYFKRRKTEQNLHLILVHLTTLLKEKMFGYAQFLQDSSMQTRRQTREFQNPDKIMQIESEY